MYFPIIDVLKENFIAKIPSIVTKWLTDNVDPVGSAVVVDTSLSISGAAADAKITGIFSHFARKIAISRAL